MVVVFKRLPVLLFLLVTVNVFHASADDHFEKMILDMSFRERIGQMILVYNSPYEFLATNNIGGVLIMQNMLKKPDQLKKTIRTTQSKMKIPLLVAIDQEGGTVNRLGNLPQWKEIPSAWVMKHWPKDSIVASQEKIAWYLDSLGINLNLAPVLDPATNYSGIQTFIDKEKRSYGTNFNEIAPPAHAFITAFSQNAIGCVVKHFPGYDVPVNSDHAIAISDADSIEVFRHTIPFQALNKQYSGIMMSSILYEDLCDVPAVFCSKIVRMAREITPDGIVMTDDLWGVALRSFTYPEHEVHPVNYPDTAFIRIIEFVVKAGNDMLMITYPQKVGLMITTIEKMMQRDPAVQEHVNAAVRRILMLKDRLRLFADYPVTAQE